MRIKTDTDNLLHSNPALYEVFEDDKTYEMARFIYAILKEYCKGKHVLDVGSGLGREVGYLHEKGYEAVGIDISEEMVIWAREMYLLREILFMILRN